MYRRIRYLFLVIFVLLTDVKAEEKLKEKVYNYEYELLRI
jgi:hypothetical protein